MGNYNASRACSRRDDPQFQELKPGALVGGNMRILAVSPVEWSDYLALWVLEYHYYFELDPCPCCGEPRGAGHLHP